MSFDLTRSNLFATTFYSLVLIVVFWGSGAAILVSPMRTVAIEEYWLSQTLNDMIDAWPVLCQIVAALMAFVCSLMVARLAIRNVLYLERTYMPSLLFVIISSTFYVAARSILPIIVAFLVLRAMSLIFQSYQIKNIASGIYLSAGFYFGVAAAIYPPSAYLVLMLFVGLGIFRLSDIREWIAAGVGFLLPLGLFFYIMWLMGHDVVHQAMLYWQQLNWHDTIDTVWRGLTVIDYTLIGVICALVFMSYVVFLRSRKRYKLRGVLSYNYLFCFLLWSVAVMLVSPSRSLYLLPVVAIPLSVLIPTYFASGRSTFLSNFLYALLILSSIAIHFVR